jgi:hypothetical protein
MSAFACLLIGLSTLMAQGVGDITGRVTDPSGAVVPNARITATRVETGVSQSTVSTAAGTYTLPRLPVGTYRVTAEAGGFKTGVASDVTLDVSQQRQVDFTLVMGEVKSTVQVSAAPPLLDTTNGTLAGVVSEEQVQNLPLNGRDIGGLVMLQPGMVQASSTGWESDGWVGNGNRAESAVGSLDGADTTDAEFGSVQFTNLNLDAIAEFKVL